MTRTTWPAALAVLITTAAQAGDCRNFSRCHDQIVLVPPSVQYFVGAPLRQQALAYGTAPGYGPPAPQVYGQPPAQGYGQPPAQPVSPQDWAAFQAWKAQQLQQQPQQNQPGPPPGGQAAAPNPADGSAVAASCLKCHDGTNGKTDFRLDGPLHSAQILTAAKRVAAGEMPPASNLTPQQRGRVVYDLLNWRTLK